MGALSVFVAACFAGGQYNVNGVREDVLQSEIEGDTLLQLRDALGDNFVLCASQLCFVWAGYSMDHVRAEARLPGVADKPPTVPGPTIPLKMWHFNVINMEQKA